MEKLKVKKTQLKRSNSTIEIQVQNLTYKGNSYEI